MEVYHLPTFLVTNALKLARTIGRCKICGDIEIVGPFFSACTNQKCKRFLVSNFERCEICGLPRVLCSC